jgi:dienelactone hydrolase
MIKNGFFILFCLFVLSLSSSVSAQNILWQQTIIPMQEAGDKGLETLLVWPDSPGKHPLVLISHGSPRDIVKRRNMTAISFLPIAQEFARRGFAVAVVLRRGYGHSGGSWSEFYETCKATAYPRAAFEASKDLHTSIDYLATLPQFDVDHIIPVGVSAGGFATIALTAFSPPKGLIAAIIFAGGRGSYADNKICEEDKLIATFGILGKTSRVPMLWVYSQNDHFFNMALAAKLLKAFNINGGQAQFIQAPAFGKEGHFLFSTKGIPIWTGFVDEFLKNQPVNLFKPILPLPEVAHLVPPSQLSSENKKIFLTYLNSPPHKAFAISATGAFGWSSGGYTVEEAKKKALKICKEHNKKSCYLYAVGDSYLN